MIIFRIIGYFILIFAFIALISDGTKTLAQNGEIVMTSLGQHWYEVHQSLGLPVGLALNTLQAGIERNLSPYLWDPVVVTILLLPTWIVLGVLGYIFYLIGRTRKKVQIYSN